VALSCPMSGLATVVAVALVAFLLSFFRTGGCQGLVCGPILFPSLA